jgi:hypothetical protein
MQAHFLRAIQALPAMTRAMRHKTCEIGKGNSIAQPLCSTVHIPM